MSPSAKSAATPAAASQRSREPSPGEGRDDGSGDALIEFADVTRRYGVVIAVRKFSMRVPEGSVFGFIGPNGAGKTTTIKMLVGLLSPHEGRIQVANHRMPDDRDEVHRRIGYLSQNASFQSWRTAEHALVTFGLLSGIARADIERQVARALDLVGLASERRKKVIHMSGGMQRRLGLAQAILHEPSLLVLDEPLAGLDPANRQQVKSIIEHFVAKGVTVLFSSHILSDVQDVATHIGIIDKGYMLRSDRLRDLKAAFSVDVDLEVVLAHDSGRAQELVEIDGVSKVETPGEESGNGGPGGPRYRHHETQLVVHLDGSRERDDVTHDLIQALIAKDFRLRSLRPLTPSLDDIYFQILKEASS